ncbi:MAG: aminoglycoside nucleotidyltransferase [Chloroflexi bacterium]|nr:aminoglycoside nucleotidyltransferase [Chloroflexota bacterium]
MSKAELQMSAQDVIEFVRLLEKNNIEVWIDGGWAVDALLGSQTRPHEDLDIVAHHRDTARIRSLLQGRGYVEIPRDDSWLCNFVLGDAQGHRIDVHSCEFDSQGKCIFGVQYPFESLQGNGSIASVVVKCITPEWMVKFHSGYTLDGNDYQDVKALCDKFNMPLPEEYQTFLKK